MPMAPDDLMSYPCRATSEEALDALATIVDVVTDQDVTFAYALEDACGEGSIDFAFAYAHCANETDFYRDSDFTQDNNPAGIGHPDGASGGLVFPDVATGARFYVGELCLKMDLPVDWIEDEVASWPAAVQDKWRSVQQIILDPTYPEDVSRIEHLNDRFGPNDREAVWMTDPNGPQAICDKGNALFPHLADQGEEPPVEPTTPPASALHILVNAGHHSTDRTGNDAEEALTFDLSLAWVNELLSRGFAAESLQRDADSDSDPNDVVGDLDDIGQEEAAWMARTPGDLVLISCHYNGAHSPLHAIVPDNVNLSTAVPNGDPPDDTAANNTLDCDLGSAIITTMNRAGLGGIYTGRLGRPGLMSERETGVGLDGWRLAEMAYTAPHRKRAVRLVIEHGGTSDPAARRFADFARAGVDAIVAVYGEPGEPPEPERIYPSSRIPVEVVSQGFVLTPTCPDRFKCIEETPLRTYPHVDAPAGTSSGATVGETYTFAFTVDVDDADWLVSKAGSWAPADAFVLVD